jgi:glycyl-tRNA synthetase (class II)
LAAKGFTREGWGCWIEVNGITPRAGIDLKQHMDFVKRIDALRMIKANAAKERLKLHSKRED